MPCAACNPRLTTRHHDGQQSTTLPAHASASQQPADDDGRRSDRQSSPGWTRTTDLRIRSPLLYPAKLRAQALVLEGLTKSSLFASTPGGGRCGGSSIWGSETTPSILTASGRDRSPQRQVRLVGSAANRLLAAAPRRTAKIEDRPQAPCDQCSERKKPAPRNKLALERPGLEESDADGTRTRNHWIDSRT